ncbi:TadE/TadG family type IV pilus assembly protein [Collimonas fungivorans]|uniref:TadE/TadG family type IV pilus assembly protein n=1 Tax=Collimonas fungivorans TaxID=158899 RepID=UPI003FA36A6F
MYNKYKYPTHPVKGARVRNRAERGVAAIEFALVFPVFFLLLYGIITYVLIFLAQQSLALAAEEGARAALRYTPIQAQRGPNGCTTAKQLVNWLGNNATCVSTGPVTCALPLNTTAHCITVHVIYPYRAQPLVPLLLGPIMNVMVPTTIGSSATVQID